MTATQPGKVNFSEAVPNRKRGGDLRVTLSPKTVGSTSGFGGVMWLEAGEAVTEHYHPYSEEFLHVVAGNLEMSLDGVPIALAAGDSLLVPIGVRHRLVNTGTTQAHAVFHLSPLAPRPELGHVDTETPTSPEAPNPDVGGAR
ncbi:cupin domain-containing protein [Actinoalloteichus hymeniacidonis]|uniref:Cupin domain-containing protein n=1 Tax=Actinoalloteichus hymeniacidonis TaxID=340345 RepID=A0AAC9HPC7_9PSEU|nr:cupin domain-containing protein [Actinoalloteichus hymeniacidonis]AOS62906.1 cupin domain-containing protein [Actinoalloteichus hymeniacidonis]MBB5909061.1 putative monooxygenase [Actinoalloteichus hymeniacidonis]